MSNLEFLFAAVAVVWVLLFVYIFLLSRQIGDLRSEIETLRAAGRKQ